MANGTNPKPISLLPREHGAYAQLGIALAAALLLVPSSGRAWAQALATVAAFLLSEPLLLLLGRRGEKARLQAAVGARLRIALWGAALLVALGLAWSGSTLRLGLSVLPGSLLGALLLGLFLLRREHNTLGELLAAGTFASAALPVAALGGSPLPKALALTLGLAGLHGLGTFLVRAFLASFKPGFPRWVRLLPALLGLLASAALLGSDWPRALALVPLPLSLLGLWLSAAAPSPRDLRSIGWRLTVASALGAVLLVAFLP